MTAKLEDAPPPARLRADARRNREKLLEAAAAAFAEHGPRTSLEDIARRAGVGVGSLYRHFPSREHLVEAVYRREVEAVGEAARELAARLPPDLALQEWMQRLVGYLAAKRGMADSLRMLSQSSSEVFAETKAIIPNAMTALVQAAAAAGTIRSDVEPADIMHAVSGCYAAPDSPEWEGRSRRFISVLMDGLRVGAAKARRG